MLASSLRVPGRFVERPASNLCTGRSRRTGVPRRWPISAVLCRGSMIVSLQGILEDRGPDWVQVSVGGVGILLSVPASTQEALGPVGSVVSLLTHLVLREDSIALYGFAAPEERTAFQALQTVKGIGPRLALSVLSVLGPAQLASAIESDDLGTLSRPPGVGKKTAARIAVELKGKLAALAAAGQAAAPVADDPELREALQTLGYSQPEARRAARLLTDSDRSRPLEERLRRVLQALAPR